jgi:multiple sugar transport system substrate-binding protein
MTQDEARRSAQRITAATTLGRRGVLGGAAALAGGALLGRGGVPSARAQDMATPAAAADTGIAITEPVSIEYWHVNTETFGGPAVKELVAAFQAANPMVTVTERFHANVYTGLLENLQTSLAAGTPPDVAQIGYLYTDYVVNNFPFVPIADLAAEFAGEAFLAAFPANVLELGQVGGVQMGMPYAISNCVTYYNADLLAEAGLDPEAPPATWEAWRAAGETLLEATGKAAVYVQLIDDNWTTQAMIESNGGQLLGCVDGSTVAAFASPEAAAAVQFWADLVRDGLALNVLNDPGQQAFLSGEVAAYVTTIARRANLEAQAGFRLMATGFPSFGEQPVRLPAGGNVLTVFSQDEAKRRAAWAFIQYLESPEGLTIWTKGTGYIPPREGVADDPAYLGDFMAENPIQAVAVAQTPLVGRWVSFPGPNGLQASRTLFAATQEALGGQQTAADALAAAAAEVDRAIGDQPCS